MWQSFKTKSEESEFQKNVLGISKNTITSDDNSISVLHSLSQEQGGNMQRFFWEAARHQPKVSQTEKAKWK